jgi:MSHA biogenesis protein MshP
MSHNKQVIISKSFYHLHSPNKHQGSSLVIAIFIIVVLSLLGAALVKMMASSQKNVAFEVLGTRAYTAAQTGVQWQLAQLFPVGLGTSSTKKCSDVGHAPPPIDNTPGLKGCAIKSPVGCSDFLHDGVRYYTVTSTGSCDIDGEVTSRIIEVEARSL